MKIESILMKKEELVFIIRDDVDQLFEVTAEGNNKNLLRSIKDASAKLWEKLHGSKEGHTSCSQED